MNLHFKSFHSVLRRVFLMFLLGASFCLWGREAGDPTAVYLSWQRSPESTMVIRWITSLEQTENSIAFRKEGTEAWTKATGTHAQLPEKTAHLLHSIELTNLTPGCTYEFLISSQGKIFKFKTMPADLYKPIRFIAGGDMYHDELETLHKTNKAAAQASPLFVLVGGDIAYASSKKAGFLPRWTHSYLDHVFGQKFDRWHEWLAAWYEDMITPDGYMIPMVPAIGNHDTSGRFGQTPAQAPFFYTLFPFPGIPGYNVLDFGNYMSLIILDSDHTNTIGGNQSAWLASTLANRKDVPHKYALYHVPAYPSVHKFSSDIGQEIRKHWVPSFDAYGLTAAFENHEHAYKRTHPLKGDKIVPDGVVYLGDGGWGVDKPRKPRHLSHKPYIANTAASRNFIVVDVNQEHQTVTALDPDGNRIDTFSW